jgi:hypothetical protein
MEDLKIGDRRFATITMTNGAVPISVRADNRRVLIKFSLIGSVVTDRANVYPFPAVVAGQIMAQPTFGKTPLIYKLEDFGTLVHSAFTLEMTAGLGISITEVFLDNDLITKTKDPV